MLKSKSIQAKLFSSYSILITVIVITLITSFYFYTANAFKKGTSTAIQKNAEYISTQLDAELMSMNTISLKIMASIPLRELFFENATEETSLFYNQKRLNEILLSITGPVVPVHQINIFKMNGSSFGFGSYFISNFIPPNNLNSISWIRSTLDYDGSKFITLPHVDDWGLSKKIVISLNRAFSESYGQEVNSIIEIQQNYDRIAAIVEKSMPSKTTYIIDQQSNIIYPYSESSGQDDDNTKGIIALYAAKMRSLQSSTNSFTVNNSYNHNKEIVAYFNSEFSGWTVFVAESENQLLKPVITFRNYTLLGGLLILLLTLLFSYYVSKGLTIPIKKIYHSINRLNLDSLSQKSPLKFRSNLNELEVLNQSFMDMCERLKSSLETVVSSRSHEIQARMHALQSQMNPHFLYNTLTIISITAEKNNQTEIVKMCEDLSDMLRYIVSDSSSPVTIADELTHTASYLDLMKKRYLNQFHCTVDIPEEMLQLLIPKLTIQPLIENCFKYGIHVPPPWAFSIVGAFSSDKWTITVRDNGKGFTEEALQTLRAKIINNVSYDSEHADKAQEIGLANIAYRMRLFHNNHSIFEVYNHPEGGACVTIGVTYAKGDLHP